ncbi:MAG TPA: MATE family efflux transporter [Flavobacteriales bacterium]
MDDRRSPANDQLRAIATITRKDLDRLAVPAIISGIAEPIIALVDTAFVGRLGATDLAAVGISSSFFLLVLWVLAQTRSAVLAAVARYYGQDRVHDIKDLVPIALWLNFGLGLLFFAITNPMARTIFEWYNAEGEVLEKAVAYYHVRSIGHPIVLATFAMTGAFRGIQNMTWSMWISIVGAVVNLALNPLLIFGYGPVQGMGMQGSAWSSLIAQVVMFGLALWVMYARTPFRLFPERWNHPELRGLMRNSGNLFARAITLNACYYLGTRLSAGYGVAAVGAHSIAMQLWLFSAFFMDGYAAAGSVVAGRLHGAGDRAQLHRVSWQVVRVTVAIGGGLSFLYVLAYRKFGGLFTTDAEVLAHFNAVFWLVIVTQPINAVAFGWDGIFKGLGDGASLRNALLFSTFVIFIPLAYLGDHLGWELHGVWIAFNCWMIARGLWLTIGFEQRYGRSAKAIPTE